MAKVVYRERTFLDKFRCIDREESRVFHKSWASGGLTYFKRGQFEVFTIATSDIIRIEE